MHDGVNPATPESTELSSAQAAGAIFGDAFPQAEKYAELLAGIGVERGLIGPAETDRIWERHLLNCAAIAHLLPARCSLVDVGSGAGLPGIVLAMLLPHARVTLLEPLARRVDFLNDAVAELGVTNAEVVRGRAEDLAGQMSADVVTARAVAPLDKLAVLAVGLVRPGGRVLAIKGSSAESELAKARPVLGRLGVTDARVTRAGTPGGGATATVVTFTTPDHAGSAQPGARTGGLATGRGPGAQPGRAHRPGSPAAGRRGRPNSRRGGG
ncbi:MAG TPA: 16S rRNA (guanine(527)-N(7))-methyltransferase RsmG [Streptosporangiaceae bacterium]|nr:16S rRNA (guanine(527)-N(7))-methyltransferase RsmG [Streptosporangiaceae bacterium]